MSKSILEQAQELVNKDRKKQYGNPVKAWRRIAKTASLLTGHNLTPADCIKVLMATKLIREQHSHKRDNLVDLCGYADILQQIHEKA